jgi:two-component system sensor histidine kinase BaeS
MSFRLRIFLLVMVVAVTAIGATAWLTLSLTSRAFNEAQDSADRHRYEIADQVAR